MAPPSSLSSRLSDLEFQHVNFSTTAVNVNGLAVLSDSRNRSKRAMELTKLRIRFLDNFVLSDADLFTILSHEIENAVGYAALSRIYRDVVGHVLLSNHQQAEEETQQWEKQLLIDLLTSVKTLNSTHLNCFVRELSKEEFPSPSSCRLTSAENRSYVDFTLSEMHDKGNGLKVIRMASNPQTNSTELLVSARAVRLTAKGLNFSVCQIADLVPITSLLNDSLMFQTEVDDRMVSKNSSFVPFPYNRSTAVCSPGFYDSSSCKNCPNGSFCPGDDLRHLCSNGLPRGAVKFSRENETSPGCRFDCSSESDIVVFDGMAIVDSEYGLWGLDNSKWIHGKCSAVPAGFRKTSFNNFSRCDILDGYNQTFLAFQNGAAPCLLDVLYQSVLKGPLVQRFYRQMWSGSGCLSVALSVHANGSRTNESMLILSGESLFRLGIRSVAEGMFSVILEFGRVDAPSEMSESENFPLLMLKDIILSLCFNIEANQAFVFSGSSLLLSAWYDPEVLFHDNATRSYGESPLFIGGSLLRSVATQRILPSGVGLLPVAEFVPLQGVVRRVSWNNIQQFLPVFRDVPNIARVPHQLDCSAQQYRVFRSEVLKELKIYFSSPLSGIHCEGIFIGEPGDWTAFDRSTPFELTFGTSFSHMSVRCSASVFIQSDILSVSTWLAFPSFDNVSYATPGTAFNLSEVQFVLIDSSMSTLSTTSPLFQCALCPQNANNSVLPRTSVAHCDCPHWSDASYLNCSSAGPNHNMLPTLVSDVDNQLYSSLYSDGLSPLFPKDGLAHFSTSNSSICLLHVWKYSEAGDFVFSGPEIELTFDVAGITRVVAIAGCPPSRFTRRREWTFRVAPVLRNLEVLPHPGEVSRTKQHLVVVKGLSSASSESWRLLSVFEYQVRYILYDSVLSFRTADPGWMSDTSGSIYDQYNPPNVTFNNVLVLRAFGRGYFPSQQLVVRYDQPYNVDASGTVMVASPSNQSLSNVSTAASQDTVSSGLDDVEAFCSAYEAVCFVPPFAILIAVSGIVLLVCRRKSGRQKKKQQAMSVFAAGNGRRSRSPQIHFKIKHAVQEPAVQRTGKRKEVPSCNAPERGNHPPPEDECQLNSHKDAIQPQNDSNRLEKYNVPIPAEEMEGSSALKEGDANAPDKDSHLPPPFCIEEENPAGPVSDNPRCAVTVSVFEAGEISQNPDLFCSSCGTSAQDGIPSQDVVEPPLSIRDSSSLQTESRVLEHTSKDLHSSACPDENFHTGSSLGTSSSAEMSEIQLVRSRLRKVNR
eukprot:ANDGO_07821.mRNA.1 hypothetical protein